MPIHRVLPCFMIILISLSCTRITDSAIRFRSKTPDASLYEMVYSAGNWEHPEYKTAFESLGNHRIVLKVADTISGPVKVSIPWRRPDSDPGNKAVLLVDASSGEIIKKKGVISLTNESCLLAFEPNDGSSRYDVYYLPHRSTGSYYPKLTYIRPGEAPGDGEGLMLTENELAGLPVARILGAQSIDEFHSFFPMEIIATEKEVAEFVRSNPAPYYLFPEYRQNPVKMDDHLPVHWVREDTPSNGLQDTVQKGEYYTFQVGVWSPVNDLHNVTMIFSDITSGGDLIAAKAATCFNLGGTDLNGHPFTKTINIPKNKVQSLWCGIEVPRDIDAGTYRGSVIIQAKDMVPDTVFLRLSVTKEITENYGDNNPHKMSRLRWINSTIGSDKNFIARPFTPVAVSGKNISILGREIDLDPMGFPEHVTSYFTREMTRLSDEKEGLLAASIGPEVLLNGDQPARWSTEEYRIVQESPGAATWLAVSHSEPLKMLVQGRLEYDGMLDYRVSLVAMKDIEINDYILNIPLLKSTAEYMLGLGYKGGKRPESVDWKWDVANNHQEGAWLGTVNKGLQYVLRDDDYERPLNTNFYRQKPLKAPISWYNEGRGGIRIQNERNFVSVENYSGRRSMTAGDTLHFNVRFLITPFKLLDTKAHFTTRFVHRYVPIDSVVAWNGTIVNVHHANEINPFINYPFYNPDLQKAYIDEAHARGVKVKLYNTIRELSYKAYELFALRSLGDEILNDGQGGGHSWLQEHLRDHYHAAWHATSVNDAAILNKGTSRWTNYYIEGVNWLAEQQQIDGLYLDDIAFSRTTVKRLASVLQRNRDEVVIDLHSANQFNERDGYINSAFLYMEHMPYINRLWFGEYFEYDLDPDYWLTEVSGIPFGLTGEMLEGGGHPWRGLVYGMTSRIYGDVDPRPIWKFFDDYDIANSEMLGYWVDRSPVKTNVPGIKSTVYLQDGQALIAIGSWSEKDEEVPLRIDWTKLGLEKRNVRLYSPEIKGLQSEQEFDIDSPVPVERQQGRVLVIEIKKQG